MPNLAIVGACVVASVACVVVMWIVSWDFKNFNFFFTPSIGSIFSLGTTVLQLGVYAWNYHKLRSSADSANAHERFTHALNGWERFFPDIMSQICAHTAYLGNSKIRTENSRKEWFAYISNPTDHVDSEDMGNEETRMFLKQTIKKFRELFCFDYASFMRFQDAGISNRGMGNNHSKIVQHFNRSCMIVLPGMIGAFWKPMAITCIFTYLNEYYEELAAQYRKNVTYVNGQVTGTNAKPFFDLLLIAGSSTATQVLFSSVIIHFCIVVILGLGMLAMQKMVLAKLVQSNKPRSGRFVNGGMVLVIVMVIRVLSATQRSFRPGQSTLSGMIKTSNGVSFSIVVPGESKISDSAACVVVMELFNHVGVTDEGDRALHNTMNTLLHKATKYTNSNKCKEAREYNLLVQQTDDNFDIKESVFFTLLNHNTQDIFMAIDEFDKAMLAIKNDDDCQAQANHNHTERFLDQSKSLTPECIDKWFGKKGNDQICSTENPATVMQQGQLMRGALARCVLSQNSVSQIPMQHLFAWFRIVNFEWIVGKQVFKSDKNIDQEDFKLWWNDYNIETFTTNMNRVVEKNKTFLGRTSTICIVAVFLVYVIARLRTLPTG
jgi:hypothetical protein